MDLQFSVHARLPQIGDTLVFSGDGWEPQRPYARAQRETHVHTTTVPQINMGLTRSPNFVSGSAGWQIQADGSAEFNNVVVRGTIYAEVGEIGGWSITATQIKATGDAVILDSAGIITVGGAGYLQSNPFTSGTLGWRITPTEAEFGNITARGEIRTAVFRYDEVHAQAGMLLVTPNAAKLDADLVIDVAGSFNVGEAGRFAVGDFVRLKDGTADSWLEIGQDNGDGTYLYSLEYGSGAVTFRAGTAVVGYGASGEGGIVLDAITANGPFMDIFMHAGAPWTTLTTKVRVGNLAGIVDADLNPTGYGFYSDNAYLRGTLLCGAGNVLLDDDGLSLVAGSGDTNSVKWYDTGVLVAKIVAYKSSGNFYTIVSNESVPAADKVAQLWLRTYNYGMAATDITVDSGTSTQSGGITACIQNVMKFLLYNGGGQFFDEVGWWTGGVKYASITEVGAASFALDVKPDNDGRGMFTRLVNQLGISTYDLHFRSGAAPPAGYAWQGAPFGGTPGYIYYSYLADYLIALPSTTTRHFMSRAVTNAAANWQNKNVYGRVRAGQFGRCGVRLDDGTDNNYVQIFMDGMAGTATQTLSFQYRAGGGGVTTVTSSILVPTSEYYVLRLYLSYSAPNYTAVGYLLCEDGSSILVTGFAVTVGWAPAAGRAGLFIENSGGTAGTIVSMDWLKNEFV